MITMRYFLECVPCITQINLSMICSRQTFVFVNALINKSTFPIQTMLLRVEALVNDLQT